MEERGNIPLTDENDNDNPIAPFRHKRLKKSARNKIVAGVCGGLGEYLSIDPLFFRLIFLFGILLGGWGIIIYLVFAIILPRNDEPVENNDDEAEKLRQSNKVSLIAGIMLLAGLYIILDNFGYFNFLSLLGVPSGLILTLILGVILFFALSSANTDNEEKVLPIQFLRNGETALFGGVCSGFADYIGVTPGTVRIVFVLLSLFALGIPVIIYLFFLAKVKRSDQVEI